MSYGFLSAQTSFYCNTVNECDITHERVDLDLITIKLFAFPYTILKT